jgi:hypothetical protein
LVRFKDEELENIFRELQEDILCVITVFLAKNNGKYAAENRKRIVREEDGRRRQRQYPSQNRQNNKPRFQPKKVSEIACIPRMNRINC